MNEIRLTLRRWFYDESEALGPSGGFGTVFAGRSLEGENVAIKQLKLEAADLAHRELRIADLLSGQQLEHVIPILDAGEDTETGRYYIVMARADKSLQQALDAQELSSPKEVLSVLQQVASGLNELHGLVHRDLKPGNILWHGNQWKLADFGIAKFVEESTSVRTLNDCLSPYFAAPEQWKQERVSTAADLYALGCIAHTLLTGSPLFLGSKEELREQHLYKDPPSLPSEIHPSLKVLVSMLLRKSPESRPTLARLQELLRNSYELQQSPQLSAIAAAAARIERTRAVEEAIRHEAEARKIQRDLLADEGTKILWGVLGELRERLLREAPICKYNADEVVMLNDAKLWLPLKTTVNAITEGMFPQSGWDIVLSRPFGIVRNQNDLVWTASLLYARRPQDSAYRWNELAFFDAAGLHQTPRDLFERYSAFSNFKHIDASLAGVTLGHIVAFGPVYIDDEDTESFIERWTTLFALAAEDKLRPCQKGRLDNFYWRYLSDNAL